MQLIKQGSLLILVLVIALSGCKTTEGTIEKGPLQNRSADELIDAQRQQLGFETVSAKVHVNYQSAQQKQSFSSKVRIKKDSAIWVSISPLLGIELFRLIITPDSVKLVDRLNQKYFADSISLIEQMTEVPMDFQMLQALLTGRMVDIYEDSRFKASRERNHYHLKLRSKGRLRRQYRRSEVEAPIVHEMDIGRDGKALLQTFLKDLSIARQLTADYSDHNDLGGMLFPTKMNIKATGKSRLKCELSWSRLKMNDPLKMPFRIPDKYKPYSE
jgi:hypothetical protein